MELMLVKNVKYGFILIIMIQLPKESASLTIVKLSNLLIEAHCPTKHLLQELSNVGSV